MATDIPLLSRVSVFAAKVETTTGTAISLSGTDGVFNVFDAKLDGDIPPTERLGQGSLTRLAPIPGARMGKVSFKTEAYNAASAPAWLTTLLLACGCTVSSSTYTPLTGAATTLTISMYRDGSRVKSLCGCQGTAKLVGEKGKPLMWEWEFTGKWTAPTTASIIAPTYPTTVPPRFASATFTVGGTAYRIGKFEFDLGNKVVMREDVNDGATGYHSAFITDRDARIKISPEALALGTHDFYDDHLTSTARAISLAIGTGTNGVLTLAAAAAQLLNPPQDEDRDGIYLDSLEYTCTSTTADGEWSLIRS